MEIESVTKFGMMIRRDFLRKFFLTRLKGGCPSRRCKDRDWSNWSGRAAIKQAASISSPFVTVLSLAEKKNTQGLEEDVFGSASGVWCRDRRDLDLLGPLGWFRLHSLRSLVTIEIQRLRLRIDIPSAQFSPLPTIGATWRCDQLSPLKWRKWRRQNLANSWLIKSKSNTFNQRQWAPIKQQVEKLVNWNQLAGCLVGWAH